MAEGKRPDYNVSAIDTVTGDKNNRIGAAWNNDDGSITIKLNPFVVMTGGQGKSMRVWPNDDVDRSKGAGGSGGRTPAPSGRGGRGSPARSSGGGDNDDIPF